MKRKSDHQKERDKKGKARIAQYEKKKEIKKKSEIEIKTQTFFQKKDDGDWEELEYIYKNEKSN